MLLSFRIANHRSIRWEQQLLFTPVYPVDRPADVAWDDAVPVLGIFGSNAAGKSNVIDALRYMRSMVVRSHKDAEPDAGVTRYPFRLDPEALAEPTRCVIDVSIRGIHYTYGFNVDDNRILDEWLYMHDKGRKRVLFEREGDDFAFEKSWQKDNEVYLVRQITEPNALFLSVAARSRQEPVQPIYLWFLRNLRFTPTERPYRSTITTKMLSDPKERPQLLELLRAADLGIADIVVETLSPEDIFKRLDSKPERSRLLGEVFESGEKEVRRLSFTHKGTKGDASLTLQEQSRGTRALLELAGPVLQALTAGAVFVVDEVDGSLHPLLAARIIGLFQDPATNPRGAQLLFTTNEVALIGSLQGEEVLKRDQIWFVEKDESGATNLFPLSDFHPRRVENRERRYLGGSYGAVPFVPEDSFISALASREGAEGAQEQE